MKTRNTSSNATSKYNGVCRVTRKSGTQSARVWTSKHPWKAEIRINGTHVTKWFATEREAAIQADRWTIEHRLPRPLNILKRAA